MEQEVKALARELLMEMIKAYMINNPKHIPGDFVVNEWYPHCEKLAVAIIEKAKINEK